MYVCVCACVCVCESAYVVLVAVVGSHTFAPFARHPPVSCHQADTLGPTRLKFRHVVQGLAAAVVVVWHTD